MREIKNDTIIKQSNQIEMDRKMNGITEGMTRMEIYFGNVIEGIGTNG